MAAYNRGRAQKQKRNKKRSRNTKNTHMDMDSARSSFEGLPPATTHVHAKSGAEEKSAAGVPNNGNGGPEPSQPEQTAHRASVEARLRSLRQHCAKLTNLAEDLQRELRGGEGELHPTITAGGFAKLPEASATEDAERLALFHAQSQMRMMARARRSGDDAREGKGKGDGDGDRDSDVDAGNGTGTASGRDTSPSRKVAMRDSVDATAGSDAVTVISVAPEDMSGVLTKALPAINAPLSQTKAEEAAEATQGNASLSKPKHTKGMSSRNLHSCQSASERREHKRHRSTFDDGSGSAEYTWRPEWANSDGGYRYHKVLKWVWTAVGSPPPNLPESWKDNPDLAAAFCVYWFYIFLVIFTSILAILDTVNSIYLVNSFWTTNVYFATDCLFLLEYLARLWSCVVDQRYQHPLWGRLRVTVHFLGQS